MTDRPPDHIYDNDPAAWVATPTRAPHRTPPHDTATEQQLLGAILLNSNTIAEAAALTPDDFYTPTHATIWAAIAGLWATNQPTNAATVHEWCNDHGTPIDAQLLNDLTIGTHGGYSRSVPRYVERLRNLSRIRRTIAATIEATTRLYDTTADHAATVLDDVAQAIYDAIDTGRPGTLTRLADTLNPGYLDRLEARVDGTNAAGIPTGWKDLDRIIGGLRPGQLVVVAGRPAMGKSAFASGLTLNTARAGHPTLLASIEMGTEELEDRYVATETRTHHTRLRDGTVAPRDWQIIGEGIGRLIHLPLWIDDNPTTSLNTLRAAARRVATDQGHLDLLVVDYVQIMDTGRRDSRQVEVAELSRGLKRLARDIEIPVVALAQLNRGPEQRADKRPMLSDLRESGAIENDADVVIALYREDYYKPDTRDAGVLEAIVLKQRSGPIGTARLAYRPEINHIADLARS